jgi:hypothetical protein
MDSTQLLKSLRSKRKTLAALELILCSGSGKVQKMKRKNKTLVVIIKNKSETECSANFALRFTNIGKLYLLVVV